MLYSNIPRSRRNRRLVSVVGFLSLTLVSSSPCFPHPSSTTDKVPAASAISNAATSLTPHSVDIKIKAKEVVEKMAAGDFEGITSQFNQQLKDSLPAEKIEQVWNAVTQQLGSFESQGPPQVTAQQNMRGVFITCKFERGSARVEVWFDPQELIGGLWIKPAS